jgi:DNA ligase D-like protein (predicted 3'-phosphoesterase)
MLITVRRANQNHDEMRLTMPDKLKIYREKRDFRRTSEPSGNEPTKPSDKPRFVIQKHDARSLHYDFRLEVDGVLKSWAVPKGPSTDPREKRLALPTEDHPLDYIDFEGTIPEGEYGAGTVMVWDTGPYRNLKETPIEQQLDDGHAEVWLEGEKITGGYALIRTAQGEDARWLLIKMNDDAADARRNPTSTEPESVMTGRTLKEISEQETD